MTTTVSRVDVLVTANTRPLERQIRNKSKKLGEQFGDDFTGALDKELTDWAGQRLDMMRQKAMREGRESGRIFGVNFAVATQQRIKERLNSIQFDLADMFTFDDDSGLDRWAAQFDTVAAATERMNKNLQISYEEGRLSAEMAEHLGEQWSIYAKKAQEAEYANTRLVTQKAELSRRIEKIDRQLNTVSFKAYVREAGSLDNAVLSMTQRFRELQDVGAQDQDIDKLKVKMMGLADAFQNAQDKNGGLLSSFKNLPHGARQAVFWVTLFAAAMTNLAVLGSAAGAGIMVAVNALWGLGVGAGVAIAAFADLNNDLDELPESSHRAALGFQELKDNLAALQDRISERVLGQVGGAFEKLAGIIPQIAPSFDLVADAVARATEKFAELMSSTEGVAAINGAISGAAPIFEKLADVGGKFVLAMLKFFGNKEVIRSTEELIGWIDDLVTSFDEFTQNGELDRWMRNARIIFGELGELLGATATMFDNLVTEESVADTADMIDSLTGSMGLLQGIFEAIAALNPFGVIAQALETAAALFTPLLNAITPLLDAFGTLFILGGQVNEILYNMLSPLLIPLQLAFEAVNLAVEKFVEWLRPVIDALSEAGEEMRKVADDIWIQLEPAVSDLWDSFLNLLPSPEELARIIREDVIPMIQEFAGWIRTDAIPAIESFIGWIEDGVDALGGWDGIKDKLKSIGGAFQVFAAAVRIALAPLIALIDGITDAVIWLKRNIPGLQGAVQGAGGDGRGVTARAVGGLISQPEISLMGEAGREIIVPLDRPLGQIAPEARGLAAIAQGKAGLGGGGGVVVEAGAIVVTTLGDPMRTGQEVLERFVENVAS